MNVLVACEESQEVCKAFREKGHNAFSCDVVPCSGGKPEWHIQSDVLYVLNPALDGWISFFTMDGRQYNIRDGWDLIIAFPPCTYLTNAGQCNFTRKNSTPLYRYDRLTRMTKAVEFVNRIWGAGCERVVIENPPGVLSTYFQKPSQIVHPYEFGHSVNKPTCLWIRGLPNLVPTEIVDRGEVTEYRNGKKISKWYVETLKQSNGDFELLSQIRSKTFPGIAKAMAEQWG